MAKTHQIYHLNQLASLMAGHPFRESIRHTADGDTAVVQMKDVDPEQGLNGCDLYRVRLLGRKKPDYLQRGDILFVGRGYRIFAALVDQDLQNTVASPHFFILRTNPDQQNISPAYLAWYINHSQAQRYFSQHIAGTALPHINRNTLENLPIILPPLAVQQNIINAHACRLREKALLEKLIDQKKRFLDALLDKTLAHYQQDNA